MDIDMRVSPISNDLFECDSFDYGNTQYTNIDEEHADCDWDGMSIGTIEDVDDCSAVPIEPSMMNNVFDVDHAKSDPSSDHEHTSTRQDDSDNTLDNLTCLPVSSYFDPCRFPFTMLKSYPDRNKENASLYGVDGDGRDGDNPSLQDLHDINDTARLVSPPASLVVHYVSDESVQGMDDDSRSFPCQARRIPGEHTAQNAIIYVPEGTKHGAVLYCSHALCRSMGRQFRWCSTCKFPVAKGNFGRRHNHDGGCPVEEGR